MRKYTAKRLIDGYKVGAQFAGKKLIAVPEKNVKKWNGLAVHFDKQVMFVTPEMKPLSGRWQDDKFGRSEGFLLTYFEWLPGNSVEGHEAVDDGFVDFQHPLVNGGNKCRVMKDSYDQWVKMAKEREQEAADKAKADAARLSESFCR